MAAVVATVAAASEFFGVFFFFFFLFLRSSSFFLRASAALEEGEEEAEEEDSSLPPPSSASSSPLKACSLLRRASLILARGIGGCVVGACSANSGIPSFFNFSRDENGVLASSEFRTVFRSCKQPQRPRNTSYPYCIYRRELPTVVTVLSRKVGSDGGSWGV